MRKSDKDKKGAPEAKSSPQGLLKTLFAEITRLPANDNKKKRLRKIATKLKKAFKQQEKALTEQGHYYRRANEDLEKSFAALKADHDQTVAEKAMLSGQSLTDALTCIPNFRALDREMQWAISQLKEKNISTFSVMKLDLNGLKFTNDTFGESAGDRLLKATAQSLSNIKRDTDFCARKGGDEFYMILINADESSHELLLNTVQSKMNETWVKVTEKNLMQVSAIGGIYEAKPYDTMDIIFENADKAYKKKKKGSGITRENFAPVLQDIAPDETPTL